MHYFANSSGGGIIVAIFVFLLVGGVYFLPAIIAATRKVPNLGSVIVVNLFFGWTLLGWGIALAMAARSSAQPQVVIQHHYGKDDRPAP